MVRSICSAHVTSWPVTSRRSSKLRWPSGSRAVVQVFSKPAGSISLGVVELDSVASEEAMVVFGLALSFSVLVVEWKRVDSDLHFGLP